MTEDLSPDPMPLRVPVYLDHAEAVAVLAAAGQPVPVIPPGCNTVSMLFQTAEGHVALVVNQSGFAPSASDNEEQINGCAVVECLDAVDPQVAGPALEAWLDRLENGG